jgi:hypothetical protein
VSALDDIIARDSAPQQQSPLDAIIARDSAQPIPASAAGGTGAAVAQPAAGQPSWKVPGSVVMGTGDIVKGGAQDIVHGLSWLADKIAPDSDFAKSARAAIPQMQQTVTQQDQAYEAQRAAQQAPSLSGLITGQKQEPGIDWGRITGQALATAPLAAVMPAGTGLASTIAGGALSGAANGALQPVGELPAGQTFADQKLGQMGTGAVTGAVAAPVMRAVGGILSGAGGAVQRRLADAGVTMTPGQILGGAAQRTEDKLTSVPVVGDLIKNAQQRSVQSFNKATYNEVLAPLGQTYNGPIGNDGVQAVKGAINDAYDNALSRMTFKATDPQFQSEIANLTGMAQGLPAAQQQTFMNVLRTQIFGKLSPQGEMDGQTLKGVQSELGKISAGYLGDPSFDNRQLGQAIREIGNSIESSLPRYNATDAVKDLTNANAAYANFVRLRSAAGSQGAMNNGGIFTAAQLQNAVRGADKSVGKGAIATGNALMQDFSSAGQQVLGSKYPDSGTAGRSLLGLAGAAAAGHAFLPPGAAVPAAVGGAALALPYTSLGQKLAQTMLMSRPAAAVPVGNALTRYGVPLAPALGAALVNGIAPAKQ